MKILAILILAFVSCTKELRYTKEELFSIAKNADPSVTVLLPRNINEGIQCSDYMEGCMSGHTVQVKGLEMIAVEFMTEEHAKRAAIKFKGFYVRNWLLDDVSGEPVLEVFVQDKLKAQKP